jgi:excisionase family DNA binding protein
MSDLELLTIKAASERTGLPEWTIRRLILDGKIKAEKIRGGAYRMSGAALREYVESVGTAS